MFRVQSTTSIFFNLLCTSTTENKILDFVRIAEDSGWIKKRSFPKTNGHHRATTATGEDQIFNLNSCFLFFSGGYNFWRYFWFYWKIIILKFILLTWLRPKPKKKKQKKETKLELQLHFHHQSFWRNRIIFHWLLRDYLNYLNLIGIHLFVWVEKKVGSDACCSVLFLQHSIFATTSSPKK